MKKRCYAVLLLCAVACVALAACAAPPSDGKEVIDSAACTHIFGEWQTTKEPTCLEAGEQTRVCTLCGMSETKTVAALGHKLVKLEALAATDTVRGRTEGEGCSRCSYVSVEPTPLPSVLDTIASDAEGYMNALDGLFSDAKTMPFNATQAADIYGMRYDLGSLYSYFQFEDDGSATVDESKLPERVTYEKEEYNAFLYYAVPYAEWEAWTQSFFGKAIDCRAEEYAFGYGYQASYDADTDSVVFTFSAYGGLGGDNWKPYFTSDGVYTQVDDNLFGIEGKYYTNVEPDNAEKYEKITVTTLDWDTDGKITFDAWILPVELRISYENGAFSLVSLLVSEK